MSDSKLEAAMVGPFKEGYTASARLAKEAVRAKEDKIYPYLSRYEQYLTQKLYSLDFSLPNISLPNMDDLEPLSIPQINLWLQCTTAYENEPNYCVNTGFFLSEIIQKSYDKGMNNFTFDFTGMKPLDEIHLRGKEDRFLELKTVGRVGHNVLASSIYIHAQFEECGDLFLRGARHVRATAAVVGDWLGARGVYDDGLSAFEWQGNDLEVQVLKTAGKMVLTGAKNSILISLNYSLCEQVRQEMTHNKNKNKIFYLHSDGTKELYHPLKRRKC